MSRSSVLDRLAVSRSSSGSPGAWRCTGQNNEEMVDKFVHKGMITTKEVEDAFRAVPRGAFVPHNLQPKAYIDSPLGGEPHVHLSAPHMYAMVLEALQLSSGLSFLNIGSGTGYLSCLAGSILQTQGINHGIELHEDLVKFAKERVEEYLLFCPADAPGICQPKFVAGNCFRLDPSRCSYDRVYCGAACPPDKVPFILALTKIGGFAIIPSSNKLLKIKRISASEKQTVCITGVNFASLVALPDSDSSLPKLSFPQERPTRKEKERPTRKEKLDVRSTASEGLECSICCEHFDDQKVCPRLLSCGHSFCSCCLERLLFEKAINCPTCRNAVSVPAGIAGLPKNFALLEIILATPKHAGDEDLHICEACDDEQHPATSCCLNCKEDMCEAAARWHARNKASRDHRVVSLEKLKANPKLAAVPVFCPEHNDQFRFFDEECNRVVCRDCVTLKHNGHKCLSLAEAASKYRQEMQVLASKARTYAEKIKDAEARVTGMSLDLKKSHDEQSAQIQGTFKELHAALTAREQVLMNELYELHKAKSVTLTEQQDRLRIFQACLQRAMSTVQSPGDAELLVARSDIVATLEALESQPLVLEPQADCVPEFNINHEKLFDVLNSACFVSDKSTCAATTTMAGSGVKQAIIRQETSFTITAHDAKGRVRDLGGDMFAVELKEKNGEKKTEVNLEDKGDGTYLATYTVLADAKGDHTLSVLLRGAHIQGSPFVVKVINVPVGRVNCHNCGGLPASMNYYNNNYEPNRNDGYRVDGYSAVCYPKCIKRAAIYGQYWILAYKAR